jgi:hypothetical protein
VTPACFTLAQAAREGPWELPTRIRAEVTQQEALGMAMCGEPLSKVERKCEHASRLLTSCTTAERWTVGAHYLLAVRSSAAHPINAAARRAMSASLSP